MIRIFAEDIDIDNLPSPPQDEDILLEDSGRPIDEQSDFQLEPVGKLPQRDFEPMDLGDEYERVGKPPGVFDNENESLGIGEKVWISLSQNVPLRIIYTTLRGSTTERTVHPDHVYHAGNGRELLVAWCDLRTDWRAFIVERISRAKLEG